jgi:hypothetical protein
MNVLRMWYVCVCVCVCVCLYVPGSVLPVPMPGRSVGRLVGWLVGWLTFQHSEAVMDLKWVTKAGSDHVSQLTSISTDGCVKQWDMKKGLVPTNIMTLKRMPNLAVTIVRIDVSLSPVHVYVCLCVCVCVCMCVCVCVSVHVHCREWC